MRTYLAASDSTVETSIVKADKDPNKTPLTPVVSSSIIDLPVDPGKLSTKRLKTTAVLSVPIEFTVVTKEQIRSLQPQQDQEQIKKRQLTEQEIVKAALTKTIAVTPDIESFEPLRGIPLEFIHFKSHDEKTTGWASFEPFTETPPKEIAISVRSHKEKEGGRESSENVLIPDLSPLYGKTVIGHFNIVANGLLEWEKILKNFEIKEATIGIIFREGQRTLEPLTGAKITTSLTLSIVTRGTLDLTGIDSMAVTPRQLNMTLSTPRKLLNLHLLEKVHFTEFATANYDLDSGTLDGATIHADTLRFSTAPYSRDPKRVGHFKDIFRTRRVVILDEETRIFGCSA